MRSGDECCGEPERSGYIKPQERTGGEPGAINRVAEIRLQAQRKLVLELEPEPRP